jgi:hypothetical protein
MSKLATRSLSVREALVECEPFQTHGALSAVSGSTWQSGRLPEPYRTEYLDAWDADAIAYTVCSYQTPIGWVLRTGEVITPPVKYSPTTTSHQGLLYALDRPGRHLSDRPAAERQS